MIATRNRKLAQRVIHALQSHHMEGYFVENKEEALAQALALIPEGASVGWGGSASAVQIGLIDAVRNGNYQVFDRDATKTPEERRQVQLSCLGADVFIMGSNAITEDGQLVNLDGQGNRVAALCWGPKTVLIIAGMNKIVKNLDEAIARVRHFAAPVNAQRFPGDTPCRKVGACGDCHQASCVCSHLVITRNIMTEGRIKVLLVNEDLGF